MARQTLISFYKSTGWAKQRKYILMRDHYLCTEPNCNEVATEVHHIIELNEANVSDPNISLNENNLRSLCHNCHTRITKQMKANQNHNGILPLISFDRDGYPVLMK